MCILPKCPQYSPSCLYQFQHKHQETPMQQLTDSGTFKPMFKFSLNSNCCCNGCVAKRTAITGLYLKSVHSCCNAKLINFRTRAHAQPANSIERHIHRSHQIFPPSQCQVIYAFTPLRNKIQPADISSKHYTPQHKQ